MATARGRLTTRTAATLPLLITGALLLSAPAWAGPVPTDNTIMTSDPQPYEPIPTRASLAASYADIEEDHPYWYCPLDGNRICGPDVIRSRYRSPLGGRYAARCVTYDDGHTVCRRHRDGMRWVQRWGSESR